MAAQGSHLVAQGSYLAAQGQYLVARGSHLAAQGARLAAQGPSVAYVQYMQHLAGLAETPELRSYGHWRVIGRSRGACNNTKLPDYRTTSYQTAGIQDCKDYKLPNCRNTGLQGLHGMYITKPFLTAWWPPQGGPADLTHMYYIYIYIYVYVCVNIRYRRRGICVC